MKPNKIIFENLRYLYLICLTLIVSFPALAQDSAPMSFSSQQAVEYAIKNNVNIINADLETEISQARVNELIGIGLPQVKGNIDINDYLEIPTQFVPSEFFTGEPGSYAPVKFGQQYTASAGITATQLLFDGSYIVGLQASKTYVELSRKASTQTKIDVAANVTKAYYFVLVAEERLKQLNSDLERLAKLKDDTKALYDNGFVEKIDYDRIELSYNLVESSKNQTIRLVENSYNILKFQMGLNQKSTITLTEKISDLSGKALPLEKDSVTVANRIEYSILETQYKLAGLDLKRYNANRLPSIGLFGNFSTNASRDEFNFIDSDYKWYPTSIIGASLSIPIFTGFTINSQTKQARLKQDQVKNSFYLLEQNINLEYANAKTTLQNNLLKLGIEEKNRDLAREITRVSKIKYDQGVGSNLEVIDAESSLREAETGYYTSLLEAIISKIDLDKAAGLIKY